MVVGFTYKEVITYFTNLLKIKIGLPNITGQWNGAEGHTGTGAVHCLINGVAGSAGYAVAKRLELSLTLGNSIYGASETVQPLAIQTLIIIKV